MSRGTTPFSANASLESVMCSKNCKSVWSHCPPMSGGRAQSPEDKLEGTSCTMLRLEDVLSRRRSKKDEFVPDLAPMW